MSRIATGDVVYVKPQNNVYTVLAAVATLAVLIGLLALYGRMAELNVKLF